MQEETRLPDYGFSQESQPHALSVREALRTVHLYQPHEVKPEMLVETRMVRSNTQEVVAAPTAPGQDPEGYTCWGEKSRACRTLHRSVTTAITCITQATLDEEYRRLRDYSDRRPLAMYQRHVT